METNTKLSILRVLKDKPMLMDSLLKKDSRQEALSDLSDLSKVQVNFLNINFEQVKLLIYSLSL